MNQLKQQLEVVTADNIKEIISANVYDGNDLSYDVFYEGNELSYNVMQLIKYKYKRLYNELYKSWNYYSNSMFPFDFDRYEFDILLTKLANKVAKYL